VALVLTLVAGLPDARELAVMRRLNVTRRATAVIGIAAACLVQVLVATEAGWVLRPLRLGHVSGLIVQGCVGLAFAFIALVFWRRRVAGTKVRKPADATAEGGPGWRQGLFWCVAVIASPLLDVPQLIVAALVSATLQPLSTLMGSVAALWATLVIVNATQRQLVNRAHAYAIGSVVFVIASLVSLLVIVRESNL
jgi:hypothetical protein